MAIDFGLPQLVGTVDGRIGRSVDVALGLPQLVGTVDGVIGRSVDVA